MEEKKNIKKNKIVKVTALLGLFLLVFGVSYAIFSVALNGTKRNRIKTGKLALTLTDINGNKEEAGYAINLEEIVPMTDEEGLQTTPYQFVVENTGTIPASYTLDLVNDGTNTLQDQYIKYNLKEENYLKKEDNTHYRGGLYNTEPKILENNRKLDEITILPGEKIVYTLNLWLDHDADNNAMGKEFNAKIEINGSQAMAYTKGKAGDNVEYTLYKDGTLIVTGSGDMEGLIPDFIDSGMLESGTVVNNGNIAADIILKKLREKDATLFPNDINGDYTEEEFSKIYNLFTMAPFISNHSIYNYNYVESCQNGTSGDVNCGSATDILNVFDNDLEKVKQVLTYLEEIPEVKNITVDEKITFLPLYAFNKFKTRMLTLASTIEYTEESALEEYEGYALIVPAKMEEVSLLAYLASFKEIIISPGVKRISDSTFSWTDNAKVTIASSVENVGAYAFHSSNIEVDNTEEYVKNNWNANWCNNCSVKYLK